MWDLFLDDERYPVMLDANNWKIARNVDDAIWYVKSYGMPRHMSLDHDLGAGKFTGMDFLKWLASHLMDNRDLPYPSVYIHSQNPVGQANMHGYWTRFVQFADSGFL